MGVSGRTPRGRGLVGLRGGAWRGCGACWGRGVIGGGGA